MQTATSLKALSAAALALAVIMSYAGVVTVPAGAMGGEPAEPKVDCRKRKNKKKPECRKKKKSGLSDDQLYQSGYWLARAGQYERALVQFRQAADQNDPRFLNYIGFATRKLGRVEEAMTYYRRALAINPNYTLARAYLGEAYLEQGRIDEARGELAEIETRCGTACEEYVALSGQIAQLAATGRFAPQR